MDKMRTSDSAMVVRNPERRMPEFGISEKDLPAIKDWKVGQKYTMTINAEMVSSSKGSDYDIPLESNGKRKEIHNARFKIVSIDSAPTAKLAERKIN